MQASLEEAKAYMIYQIGVLQGFVQAQGGRLQYVKPCYLHKRGKLHFKKVSIR
ncbi:hypothetical protein Amet_4701 [Alkaliphilus metalliredigens QYMF]|uniref:Uncharacterized protein n=1 Tax=Alkaliphilus metalliredigens (strain QYMF) TaxID=293826 RepID=A6TX51_ALKMQ|nr:LamB/YcsF family protein [Alkaliphilus metalliredigens]ABR50769.1 hypothetical protein Amet_4701 [Alkaliphilus metalliredigens QYMF]